MSVPIRNDAELVHASLGGRRDAFGQIVARYQSLICSLAYSATGSLTRSEDLAQDTFVAAWKQLPELREPSKVRAWLCGIARNLISNAQRRAGREPAHLAEPFDATHEAIALEPSPPEQAVSREEEAILWRALERIPDIYREPLVLFYREHRSVEAVARELELSEDAVKQRLSRGRVLLHEQVLAFVEGTLERSNPGQAFTLGVMTALPLLATGAGVAAAGGVATKGATATKSVTTLAALGAVLTAGVIVTFSLLGFLMFMGACLGYVMSRASKRSPQQRDNLARCWRAIAIGGGVFGVAPLLGAFFVPGAAAAHPQIYTGLTWWMALLYPAVGMAVARWFWQWRREASQPHAASVTGSAQHSLGRWLAVGMLAPGFYFAFFAYATAFETTLTGRFIAPTEAREIIANRPDAGYRVNQGREGGLVLWIKLPENGRRVEFFTKADSATLAALAKRGITPPTRIEGRDYEMLGLPGRWLTLLACFLAPMGAVIAARLGTRRRKTITTETAASPSEMRAARIFVVGAVIAAGLLAFVVGLIFFR